MRYCFIGCEVLFREVSLVASQADTIVDLKFLPQGLHNVPDELCSRMQAEIDAAQKGPEQAKIGGEHGWVPRGPYDAILIGYCLCSNGVVGLKTDKIPMVIPRGHDCITILLGSKEKYQHYFDTHRGVYWYSSGWIERAIQPGKQRWNLVYDHYVKNYGADNADYLMQMEQGWFKEYSWATYINWDLPLSEYYRQYTKEAAEFLNWNFDEVQGDPTLVQDWINGRWDDKRFLVVPAGQSIAPSYGPDIMVACQNCRAAG